MGADGTALTPATATMPAGASRDFTLTAPPTPAACSWRVVALSRAGKKTVSGEPRRLRGLRHALRRFLTFTIFDLGDDRIRLAIGSTYDAGVIYGVTCDHGARGQNLPGSRPLAVPPTLEPPAGG
ncbi:MAG: hypothetical protein JWQ18_43, partial [Conexibacter sp.]|nr:hypothetical protein [Conexibacter sp.]